MSLHWPPTGTEAVLAFAALLLAWYAIGLHLNRRRASQLVAHVRDALQAKGLPATIRWIGRSAFRIEVEKPGAPVGRLALSVLLEPRETFLLWVVGRMGGRRDWLVLSATLEGPAGPAFEVYHPRRRGAADAVQRIRAEEWTAEPVPGRAALLVAARKAEGRELARQMVAALGAIEIWGVSLRPEEHRLTLSLPLPVADSLPIVPLFSVLPELADLALRRKS
jgi:hypothetical protein